MGLLSKLRLNQKSPVFLGLDLCHHVRLDLGFWCLSWRGLANTQWPAKAFWPAGRTLARDLGRQWHEWQSWESRTRQGWTTYNRSTHPVPFRHSQPCLVHCLCSSMPTTVGMPQLCLEIFEPFILWVIKMFTG